MLADPITAIIAVSFIFVGTILWEKYTGVEPFVGDFADDGLQVGEKAMASKD